MNKIEILRFLIYSCVAGLFIYVCQIAGIKEINRKKLILLVTLVVFATIFTILKNIEEKKAEQIAAEKADQMYYEEMFSPKLNMDFSDGTWQLSVDKRTTELIRAQFSKDGKYVLVSGIKEGNAVIDISREGEVYGGSIFVRVEEPEEWYEKLQEEIKFYSRENRR